MVLRVCLLSTAKSNDAFQNLELGSFIRHQLAPSLKPRGRYKRAWQLKIGHPTTTCLSGIMNKIIIQTRIDSHWVDSSRDYIRMTN